MSAPTAAGAAPTCWRLAHPDVWAAEQAALAAAGATWSEDVPEDEDGPAGPPGNPEGFPARLALRVQWPHPAPRPGDPTTLDLKITFPPAYPWFAPSVALPSPLPALHRHRNPISGELCLLADPGDWRPDTTVADLLATQLPRLLAAGRDSGTGPAALELEAGAEPAWTRMRLSLGALLVDTGCLPPAEVPAGWADLVRVSRTIGPVSALGTLLDGEHRLLWESRAFGGEATRVRWVRLPDLPAEAVEPGELWRRATERLDDTVPDDGSGQSNAIVVLVPSEGADRRPSQEWLLLTGGLPRPGRIEAAIELAEPEPAAEQPPPATAAEQLELFDRADLPAQIALQPASLPVRARRSYPIGPADLTARLPGNTAGLAEASVTVVGVGALGGPLALELARAGVGRLHLIDGDAHDPATGARQLLTLHDAGAPKALAVALRILHSNPHVHLTAGMRDLGADDGRELPALTASSLVIDCTANPAATRYLAAHLRLTGTPLLIASATAGGWGGVVTTLPAAGGGCWECLQLHRADRAVPVPPARADGELLAVGCSHPTYVGGWFDLGQVVLQATRTALALLTADTTGTTAAVGSPFGDVQVLTQYHRGRPVHPRWKARQLAVHPTCPLHQPNPDDPEPAAGGAAATSAIHAGRHR